MSFKNPPISASSEASVLKVEHSQPATGSVGVGMYPSLMGTFSCPAPVLMIGASFDGASTSTRSVPFRTSHMGDPWILPSPSPSSEAIETSVSFPAAMIAYQANIQSTAEPCSFSSRTEEEDPYVLPAWEVQYSHAHDCLDTVFLLDEAIIEAMSVVEPPWEELHHRSYFLPELDLLEHEDYREILRQKVGRPMIPLSSPGQMADGNMANISSTIPINISRNPGTIENVYIGVDCSQDEIREYTELFKEFRDIFAWSYDEMPGIDPRIVEHEIKTYQELILGLLNMKLSLFDSVYAQ